MDWVRGERLGQGSFATVSLATTRNHCTNSLPPLMAVKSCGVSHSASLVKEKSILDELRDCPQVIRCLGDSFTHENGERLYNVLLEYASGGSLHDRVKNSDCKMLPEIEVRRYTRALLRGLSYIHTAGYVHCDIKLQNILLCEDGSVKISDFGLAKSEKDSGFSKRCELRGTPLYMSPEMLTSGDQGAPADVWAVGCIVSEMMTGAPAWRCSGSPAAVMLRIGVGNEVPEIPRTLSDKGRDFLARCFVRDPTKRWTADMLLDHPFVRGQNCDFDFDRVCSGGIKEEDDRVPSPSPRCPFDFPDWSTDTLPSPGFESTWSWTAVERLRSLASQQVPDWSTSDDWVQIR